jgi:hypothetical protein
MPQRKSLDELTGLSRQRRWQIKKAAAGLCEICGRPRTSDSLNFCRKHLRASRVNSIRNYYKRKAS